MINYEEFDKEIAEKKDAIRPTLDEYNSIMKELTANRGKPITEEVQGLKDKLVSLELSIKQHNQAINKIHKKYR